MLHILWLILKTILILAGAVLGLILVVLLLILFCPVRYQLSVQKEKDEWKQSEGTGCISWLFHAVTFRAVLQNGEVQTVFRLFGIPVLELLEKRRKKKKKKADKKIAKEQSLVQTQENEKTDRQISSLEKEKKAEAVMENSKAAQEQPAKKEKDSALPARIWMGLRNAFISIQNKLCNIKKKLENIYTQMDWWKRFLEHPRVKAAALLVWKHTKFLIKHILPVKTDGKITFSTEDPSLSGTILAVLGMSIPFHKNCVDVIPLFNGENYLQGYINMKGRIYGFVFVRAACIIYFNENVKYVIKRWKHKEE